MKPQFYTLRKTAACLLLLLCLLGRKANAQVYANAESHGVSGLCILCDVLNPENPVNNPSLTKYSTFFITAGLFDVAVYQTLIFPAASTAGCDSLIVRIGSDNPNLSAAILGGVTIQTFNGSTPNNDSLSISTGILRILEGNQTGEVILKPAQTFDRVKVTLNSKLLGLLTSFRIYFAFRKPSLATPNATDSITICSGQSTNVTATAAAGSLISWYNASTGGTLLATGSSYTVTPAATTTYYAEATVGACKSLRKPVKVIVNPKPGNPAYSVPQGLLCGSLAIPVTNHAAGLDYRVTVKFSFFGTPLYDTSYTVVNKDTVYTPDYVATKTAQADIYIQAVNPVTGCKSDSVHKVYNLNASGGVPIVDFDSTTICKYDSVTLHARDTVLSLAAMQWYDKPVGDSLLYTGNFYKVSPEVTTTYYVATLIGCENPIRKPVKVTVKKIPDPVTSVTPNITCGPVKIAILNHQPGYIYRVRINYVFLNQRLFDTSFVVVNKDTIVTPDFSPTIAAHGETYIQAVDPVSGCRSDSAFLEFILSGDGGAPKVDADSVTICKGDSVTLHAYNPINEAFKTVWYDAPVDGHLLFTGNYFKVKPTVTTTYYVTSKLQCEYKFRKPVKVKVNICSLLQQQPYSHISTDANNIQELSLYPNPTNSIIRFAVKQDLSGSQAIVRDINGREVQRVRLTQNGFILLPQLSHGTYFIEVITSRQEVYRGKIILNR